MRFTAALVIGAAVAVSAQSSSSTSSAAASTASMTPEEACVQSQNCKKSDVNCIAECYKVPYPNESQVVATNNCVNKCPKSDNTDAGNKAWGECQNKCITDHYLPGGSGSSGSDTGSSSDASSDSSASNGAQTTPTDSTGSAGSNTASTLSSNVSPSQGASKTSDDSNASKSSSGATDTSKPNSAAGLGGASAAVFGLVAALFAM